MRISDWGSDVCSSALRHAPRSASARRARARARRRRAAPARRQLRLRAPPARRPPPRAELELELGLERIGGVDGSAGETAASAYPLESLEPAGAVGAVLAGRSPRVHASVEHRPAVGFEADAEPLVEAHGSGVLLLRVEERKSTRLNSSH